MHRLAFPAVGLPQPSLAHPFPYGLSADPNLLCSEMLSRQRRAETGIACLAQSTQSAGGESFGNLAVRAAPAQLMHQAAISLNAQPGQYTPDVPIGQTQPPRR